MMTRHRILALATVLGAVFIAAAPVAAQQSRDDVHWDGVVSSGHTLYLRNLNGAVRVEPTSGRTLQIDAHKRWRRGNPEDVRVEIRKTDDGDVLACALWGERSSCDERGYHSERNRTFGNNNDVAVEFIVRVPEGVKLDLSTVNGELTIDGATDRVDARTVNGSIQANSLGGPVRARTVNGSIRVRMGDTGHEDLSYETVNGSVSIEIPRGTSADLEMQTVNGRLESDFPLTVQGRISPRHLRAQLGNGGRKLFVKTVNGSVTLRQGG